MLTGRRLVACMLGVACVLGAPGVLGGCATPSRDPFVGTWRASSGGLDVVIVRERDDYSVTMVTSGGTARLAADRHGDELDAVTTVIPGRRGWAVRQVFALHAGALLLVCAQNGSTLRLSRASPGTAIPTMSPSATA
jgi:hypothetical protein